MDFQQVKSRITNYHDILSWKNPIDTAVLLGLYNIFAFIFIYSGISVINIAVWKIFTMSIIVGLKARFSPSNEECGFFSKNNMEKLLNNAFTYVNNFLDEVRRCIYLEYLPCLAKAVGALCLFISLGKFSSFFVILMIGDAVLLSRNPIISEKSSLYFNKFYNIASEFVMKYVPKFAEKK